ncbi:hypothetical protein [Salinarimonas soli]|uniref:Uncharacterized protein n=1 Tax=Salinarimonas soli TaxID=1638099 RepID=A0A5B2VRU1_9HYPH|nr:hypothetical protein [Salinarimonas soli]KAA2241056.1 hypothetical protein F0L46_05310 [Salinarimonas soli]
MPRTTRLLIVCATLAGAAFAASAAMAQNSGCADGQEILAKRRGLIERLNTLNKNKKMDPRSACKTFGDLVSNGNTAIKWMETNKDWCQVPANLIDGMKADNDRATKFRTQACQAASKVAEMERRAKQQQQSGGGGLLGGDGLTGTMRMPKGAL